MQFNHVPDPLASAPGKCLYFHLILSKQLAASAFYLAHVVSGFEK